MRGTRINGSKRKIVKAVTVVAGVTLLPGTWTKPIVNSVLLPAHAQTSDDTMPPSGGNLMFSTDANGVVNGTITVTDNVDTAPAINLVSSPTKGTVVFANAKTNSVSSEISFTYTATDGSSFAGDDSFTYRAVDASGNQSLVYTVSISSAPLVDDTAPTGEDASVQANSDGVATGTLSASDDTDPNPRVSIVAQPSGGSVALSGRDFTYTANAGPSFTGSDSFTYKVVDASGNESPVYTVTVSASSPTDTTAPTGEDASEQANADGLATGTLVANDETDPSPSVMVVSQPSAGTVSLSGYDFNYMATAGSGFTGSDMFTYKVVDSAGNESPTYTITIIATVIVKTLVIPGGFVSCSDADFPQMVVRHGINDDDPSSPFVVSTNTSIVDGGLLIDSEKREATGSRAGETLINVGIFNNSSGIGIFQYCSPPHRSFRVGTFDVSIVSTSGVTWSGTAHWTRNTLDVSISDITVTRS